MKNRFLTTAAVALAGLGAIVPQSTAMAATAPVPRAEAKSSVMADVALAAEGTLLGQVVDSQGLPLADTTVSLQADGKVVAEARTNAEGYFAVHGLRGGNYLAVAANGATAMRVWTHDAAPPVAKQTVMIVSESNLVRGQGPSRGGLVMLGFAGAVISAGLIAQSHTWNSGS